MKIKKYILLFTLNSFLWCLLYFLTEITTPDKPNPEGIWDLNMNGFLLALAMFFGVHLIPLYLFCIKKIYNNKFKFFLLNFFMIVVLNPMVWLSILIYKTTLFDLLSTSFLLMFLIHSFIFTIIFFIKQLYYKINTPY